MAGPRRLGELFYEIRAKTEFLQRDVGDAERQLGKLSKFIVANPVAAVGGVATALAGVAVAAINMATKVETSMRRVKAVTTGTTGDIKALQATIASLSRETGRSQADLAAAAEAAARNSESVAATGQRLQAGLKLAQVSGEDLTATLDGLDQVLDLFQLGSEDAGAAVAELFAAARGKAPISELFAVLQAGAPSIKRLGLDLPTAARALLQLADAGGTTKQAASELARLVERGDAGREALVKLAAEIPATTSAVIELDTAFAEVNTSTANAAARIREEFNATMIELGTTLLPAVNAGLQQLLRLFGSGDFATKEFRNARAALLAFGEATQTTFTGSEQGFKEARRAVLLLAEAAKNGKASFADLDREGLGALQARVEFFSRTRFLSADQLADVRLLRTELEGAAKAMDAPKLGKPGAPTSDGLKTTEELKRAAAAAATAREAFTNVTQGFEDLFEKARTGSVSVADFAVRVRELGDTFRTKLTAPTAAQSGAFAALVAQSDEVREALRSLHVAEAAKEFRELEASLTPTIVDDLTLAFAKLQDKVAEGLKLGAVTEAQADRIFKLQRALDSVAIGAEQYADQIDRIKASAISSFDAQVQLIGLLQEYEEQLRALATADEALAGDAAALVMVEGLKKRIAELKEQIESLGGTVRGALDPGEAGSFAAALSNAADAAFGMSTALLGADHIVTRMIGSAGQVASGFAKIAALAKEAGGISRLFEKGGGLLSALPALGAIVGGIGALSSLVFRPDPQEEARQALLAENNRRLKDLRDGLVAASLSGGAATAAALLRTPFVRTIPGPRDDATGEATTVEVKRNVRDVLAELAALGFSLADVRRLAKDLGIEFAGFIPTLEELQQVQVAAHLNFVALIAKYRDTISGMLEANEVRRHLDPDRSPLDGLLDDLAILGGPKGAQVFAEIAEMIARGDFEGAKQRLRDFWEELLSPDFDWSSLGDIDPADIKDIITGIFDRILKVEPKIKTAAEKFADAVKAYDAEFEAGAITAAERAKKIQAKAKELFPDLFETVDFSSAEKFKESFANMVAGFAADGEITEAEQLQIDIARALGETFGYLTDEMDEAKSAAQAFADALSAAFDDIDFDLELHGITDPLEQFRRMVDGLRTTWPEMAAIFDQFDLSTEAGRKAAEEAFVAWAQGLTDPAARNAALRILGRLRAVPGEADPAGGTAEPTDRSSAQSGVQTITERTGNLLVDLLRTANRQRQALLDRVALLTGGQLAVGGTVFAPVDPSALLRPPPAPVAPQGGGLVVRIHAPTYILGPVSGDPEAVGAAVGAATSGTFAAAINRALGADLTTWRRFGGGHVS